MLADVPEQAPFVPGQNRKPCLLAPSPIEPPSSYASTPHAAQCSPSSLNLPLLGVNFDSVLLNNRQRSALAVPGSKLVRYRQKATADLEASTLCATECSAVSGSRGHTFPVTSSTPFSPIIEEEAGCSTSWTRAKCPGPPPSPRTEPPSAPEVPPPRGPSERGVTPGLVAS
jgi:hypothetical protein